MHKNGEVEFGDGDQLIVFKNEIPIWDIDKNYMLTFDLKIKNLEKRYDALV